MTVLELKQAVIHQFNAKAASLSATTASVAAVDEALATLSWGSALLTPEEAPLASFGLTSHHSGATLVLETYPSWAERLNAIAFAAAGANSKGRRKDTSGIRDAADESETSHGLTVAAADDVGFSQASPAATAPVTWVLSPMREQLTRPLLGQRLSAQHPPLSTPIHSGGGQ